MSIFEAPKWDVNKASDKLNKELFGSKHERKQQKIRQNSGTQYVQRQESEDKIINPPVNKRKRKRLKQSSVVKDSASPEKLVFSDKHNKQAKREHKNGKFSVSPINSVKQNVSEPVAFSELSKRKRRRLRDARRKLEKTSYGEVPLTNVSKNSDDSVIHVSKKKKKKLHSFENSLDTPKMLNSGAEQSVSEQGHEPKLSKNAKRKLKKQQFLLRNLGNSPMDIEINDSHSSGHMKKGKKKSFKNVSLNEEIQEPASVKKHIKSNKDVFREHSAGQFMEMNPAEVENTDSFVPKKKKKKRKKKKQNELLNISDTSVLSVDDSSESCAVFHENNKFNSPNNKKRKHGEDPGQAVSESNPKNKKPKLTGSTVDENKQSKRKKKKRNHSVDVDLENETTKTQHKKHDSVGRFHDDRDFSDFTPSLENKIKEKEKKDDLSGFKSGGTASSPHFIQKLKQIVQNQQNASGKKKGGQTLTLRERMLKQLQASRFRYLNEQLYSCEGKDALKLFRSDPGSFKAYHSGYQQQVAHWPLNPLDKIINSIRKKSKDLVIADFGCGDARLARSVPNKVHSFDLVALSDEVTACDMAHTPLNSASVDIAVFCLSLMGTILASYLLEANRVLKVGGQLKIAEVESRFENVDGFIKDLTKFGFVKTFKDFTHNLFYFMDFKKQSNVKYSNKLPQLSLKPCLYKKR